jgi:hypothetical protein
MAALAAVSEEAVNSMRQEPRDVGACGLLEFVEAGHQDRTEIAGTNSEKCSGARRHTFDRPNGR